MYSADFIDGAVSLECFCMKVRSILGVIPLEQLELPSAKEECDDCGHTFDLGKERIDPFSNASVSAVVVSDVE